MPFRRGAGRNGPGAPPDPAALRQQQLVAEQAAQEKEIQFLRTRVLPVIDRALQSPRPWEGKVPQYYSYFFVRGSLGHAQVRSMAGDWVVPLLALIRERYQGYVVEVFGERPAVSSASNIKRQLQGDIEAAAERFVAEYGQGRSWFAIRISVPQ